MGQDHLYFQGQLCQSLPVSILNSQAFLLGLNAFTTLRVNTKGVEFWPAHRQRLTYALNNLFEERGTELLDAMENFVHELRPARPCSVRLNLIDQGEQMTWIAFVREISQAQETPIVIKRLPQRVFPFCSGEIKLANYAEQMTMLKRYPGADEIIFEDTAGAMVESIFSNIFIFDGKCFKIPKAKTLKGIYLSALKAKSSLPWIETDLYYDGLKGDELLVLSNCVKGLRLASEGPLSLNKKQQILWNDLLTLEREMVK